MKPTTHPLDPRPLHDQPPSVRPPGKARRGLGRVLSITNLVMTASLLAGIAAAAPKPPPQFTSTLLTTDVPYPSSLAFGPDGQLYVSALGVNAADGGVWVVNPVT